MTGKAGRNITNGPGLVWNQVSVAKDFRFGERLKGTLRVDVNNPFKVPFFSAPNSTVAEKVRPFVFISRPNRVHLSPGSRVRLAVRQAHCASWLRHLDHDLAQQLRSGAQIVNRHALVVAVEAQFAVLAEDRHPVDRHPLGAQVRAIGGAAH